MSPVKPEHADDPVTPLDRALWLINKLGGDATDGKEGHCLCPAHDDENPSLDVSLTSFTKTGQPVFTCRAKCEQGAVIAALRARGAWPIPRDLPPRSDTVHIKQHRSPEQRREYAREIFRLVQDYDHRLVKAEPYFRNRGIKEVPKEAWITAPTKIKDDYRLLSEDPGIVFEVKDREGKFCGIHVIWLNDTLTDKRAAEPHRQSYGPIKGGFVQLGKLDKARPLVVAEGIETALAVLQITGLPCALVGPGTNFMEAIDLPDHSEIIIAADNGEAGQDAARKLAQRYVGANRTIRIATPVRPQGGKKGFDWNDALLTAGADAAAMKEAILNAPAFEQQDEDDEDEDQQPQEATQVDVLLGLAANANLFHDDDNGYADIYVDGHRETWPTQSTGLRRWLQYRYYKQEGSAPTGEAMRRTIETLAARARFDGPARKVRLRVGGVAGKIYLDLCDADWRAVEIDAHGWRVVQEPPVRFIRAPGMLALPVPIKGGSITDLRPFVNIQPDKGQPDRALDSDFILLIAFAVGALRDQGPYVGLAITGEEGTAKTTLVQMLCQLVDPRKIRERRPPRDERDLHIAASKAHIITFGNLSEIPDWLSAALCTVSTGGGFATRSLYTNDDEVLFDAIRPIILNGIEFVTRPDLADRHIFLKLPPVRDKDRRVETEFWASFEKKRPSILGALLDMVAYGVRQLPNTPTRGAHPRMADFDHWLMACEGAVWKPGTFADAYDQNRARATIDLIEGETVAMAVLRLMDKQDEWSGTATKLLDRLEGIVGDKEVRRKHWPGSAAVLGRRLRGIASRLRKSGLWIDFGRERDRTITLKHLKPVQRDGTAAADSKTQTSKARKGRFEPDMDRRKAYVERLLRRTNGGTGQDDD
jgi:phage/plasmid primase-like uncharacterized protein